MRQAIFIIDNRYRQDKKRLYLTLLVTAGMLVCQSLFAAQNNSQNSNLQIEKIELDPIRRGKNQLKVHVNNSASEVRTLGIHIQTNSPDYGGGVGWGGQFFFSVPSEESDWYSAKYRIYGPITPKTRIRLRFYDLDSPDNFVFEKFFHQKAYTGEDLTHYEADPSLNKPASQDQQFILTAALQNFKKLIRSCSYTEAWKFFSRDYKTVEYRNQETFFIEAMEMQSIGTKFTWLKDELLTLQPLIVQENQGILLLTAQRENETWTIDFVQESGGWKIDWISGYTPLIVKQHGWQEKCLSKMQNWKTPHFEIYYTKDSYAESKIEDISHEREKAYTEITRFLGDEPDTIISLILFEDEKSKFLVTGHMGMGWAFDQTIVEVYSAAARLDPYHETVHILMHEVGDPPALFNEGFAVYMSELLGGRALLHLGGGDLSIAERFNEITKKGESLRLGHLLSLIEIGSEESRPEIAYPSAASFVKFLIEEYGKIKFLQAYHTLRNSDKDAIQEINLTELSKIYNQSLERLEAAWRSWYEDKSSISSPNIFDVL